MYSSFKNHSIAKAGYLLFPEICPLEKKRGGVEKSQNQENIIPVLRCMGSLWPLKLSMEHKNLALLRGEINMAKCFFISLKELGCSLVSTECLHEALGVWSQHRKINAIGKVVAWWLCVCNPSTQEPETVQGHPPLPSTLEANLGYEMLSQKKKKCIEGISYQLWKHGLVLGSLLVIRKK